MGTIKGIPYGMSNFEDVITQNRYYVDKTMYIPMLEDQANYLIFIRPRRFGKSLLLSMLRSYYDLSQKDKFQQLFGNLWIGQNTTPLQGKYQMLYLDFSKIGGNIDELLIFNTLERSSGWRVEMRHSVLSQGRGWGAGSGRTGLGIIRYFQEPIL